MKMPFRKNRPAGFALISTLAILVIVSILIVAYTSTMRSERAASQNFVERERAQAIAQGMLNRILAEHAAPELSANKQLKPYSDPEYYDDAAKLPRSTSPYLADPPVSGIYTFTPQPNVSSVNNTLVRISRAATGRGDEAYAPKEWAYMRQNVLDDDPKAAEKINAFYPQDSGGNPVAPQWVDYYEPLTSGSTQHSDIASGRVAFVIWDESGKIDINMAGRDPNVNGMAPHNLGLENLSNSPTELLAYLDNREAETNNAQPRQRSNFSLRTITGTGGSGNDIGNDRWFFTNEELLAKNLIDPKAAALQVTTVSRDFDVRPEWDGDRRAMVSGQPAATKFLKAYVNNPDLFTLFTTDASVVSSALVAKCVAGANPVGQKDLEIYAANTIIPELRAANASNVGTVDNWTQVLHLLATLRLSLPPYQSVTLVGNAAAETTPLKTNYWYDEDVFGILVNILGATSPASDQNLIAYDRRPKGSGGYAHKPFNDPNSRIGVRISPLITEVAIKAERINDATIKVTEYIELWNPYPFPLVKPDGKPIEYSYGEWTGRAWPQPTGGKDPNNAIGSLYATSQKSGYSERASLAVAGQPKNIGGSDSGNLPLPGPGRFVVVQLSRDLDISTGQGKDEYTQVKADGTPYSSPAQPPGLRLRVRPFLQNYDYFSAYQPTESDTMDQTTSYSVSIGPFFAGAEASKMQVWIPASKLTVGSPPAWYSFQIDDPRMGPATRYVVDYRNQPNPTGLGYGYSWIGYPDKHSLFGESGSAKYVSPYGDGYNQNFGANWPGGSGFDLNNALSTFALPGRPFFNVGELGGIFAERPWRTLSFGLNTAPTDPVMKTAATAQPAKAQNYPTTLLDYLTTIGNTAKTRDLNFKSEAASPEISRDATTGGKLNKDRRKQDLTWLFDKVDATGAVTSDSNLRPIRGRINLNAASKESITRLLQAPYRMVPSLGLYYKYPPDAGRGNGWVDSSGKLASPQPTLGDASTLNMDYQVTISKTDAEAIAGAITETDSKKGIRPLHSLADLGKLDLDSKAGALLQPIRANNLDSVMDAVFGRLAQFGTVRQQYYTIDLIAEALNPNAERRRKSDPKAPRVVAAEVRILARVYFDTFSRKAYIESIEYR